MALREVDDGLPGAAGQRAGAADRCGIEVEEVGGATLFLASDLSSGMTGETMYVDAGFNITAG